MGNWTKRDLNNQFRRMVRAGWLSWFQQQARRVGTTTAHLLAIASRETNLANIRGDFRNGVWNGYGVMQVDIGTDSDYARNWTAELAEPGIRRGAEIWRDKLAQVVTGEGKTLRVRGRKFTGRATKADDDRRIATAAYNCGLWAYYHFSHGQHIDSTTTGRDYSRDVYDRAVEFADFLEKGGYEPDAIKNELAAQGKYARTRHRERFNLEMAAVPRVKLPEGEAQDTPENVARVTYHQDDGETALLAADQPQTPDGPPLADMPETVNSTTPANAPPAGQTPNEPATQITPTGFSRWWGEISGTGLLSMAGLKAALSGEKTLMYVAIAAVAVIIVALIFRKTISEAVNKWIASDPNRFNVR
jgi:hypothetical protein